MRVLIALDATPQCSETGSRVSTMAGGFRVSLVARPRSFPVRESAYFSGTSKSCRDRAAPERRC